MTELVGIRAYARHRGVSHQAVMQAIKRGRLSASVVGEGRGKKLDRRVADLEWEAKTDPRKVRPKASRKGGAPAKQGELPGMEGEEAPEPRAKGLSHATAAAAKVAMDVKLKQLDYEERMGNLLDRGQVERESFELARLVRDQVMGVPEGLGWLTHEQKLELRAALRTALSAVGGE